MHGVMSVKNKGPRQLRARHAACRRRGLGYMGPAATARVPVLSPNDHPNPSQRRQNDGSDERCRSLLRCPRERLGSVVSREVALLWASSRVRSGDPRGIRCRCLAADLPLVSATPDTIRRGWVLRSHVLNAAGSYSTGASICGVVHFAALIPNKTRNHRWTLVACLVPDGGVA